MKNFKKVLFTVTLCLFTGSFLFAQEKENKKIHIKIKKNETIIDTSFTIDEEMDKDEVRKMIHELTGMDVKVHHGDEMDYVYAISTKDSTDCDSETHMKKMDIHVTVDDDEEKHVTIYKHGDADHKKWVDHKSGNRYVIIEEPVCFTTKDGKEIKLSVIDKESGTDIALDKVKVIKIKTTEDGTVNIVVSDKKEKAEVKEKTEIKKKVKEKKKK